MDSLSNILAQKDFDTPTEVVAIQRYVKRKYDIAVSINLKANTIVIVVPSASLASSLRMQTTAIQKTANTTKRLVFRIE